MKLTREQRIDIKKKEIELIKEELKKSHSPFHTRMLKDELRFTLRELYKLIDNI